MTPALLLLSSGSPGPLWLVIASVGLLASAVLAVVVAVGWVSLRERVLNSTFYRRQDFGDAWFPAFFCGLAMTAAGVIASWICG